MEHILEFRESIEAAIDPRSPWEPDWIYKCEGHLTRLAESGHVLNEISASLKSLLSGPTSDAPAWLDVGLYIAGGPTWTLRAVVYEKPSTGIYTFPYVALIRNIGRTSYAYRMHDLPESYENGRFSKGLSLGEPTEIPVQPGQTVLLDGRRQALDIRLDGPVVALRLYAHLPVPLQWKFSRTTGQSEQAIANLADDSQLVSMAMALGGLADKEAISTLLRLSDHRHHFVRWEAIKQLARLSRDDAVQRLKRALDDDHPEIRMAAARTLGLA